MQKLRIIAMVGSGQAAIASKATTFAGDVRAGTEGQLVRAAQDDHAERGVRAELRHAPGDFLPHLEGKCVLALRSVEDEVTNRSFDLGADL